MNRPVVCGNCGKEGHNLRSCKKSAAKAARHFMPWQVRPGNTFWAPYGDKGWSAVTILEVGRVWGKAERIKPKTGDVVNRSGRVRLDELLLRDPKVKGADRPTEAPSVMFTKFREERLAATTKDMETRAAALVVPPEPVEAPPAPPAPKLTPTEAKAHSKLVTGIFDLLEDQSTTDDW